MAESCAFIGKSFALFAKSSALVALLLAPCIQPLGPAYAADGRMSFDVRDLRRGLDVVCRSAAEAAPFPSGQPSPERRYRTNRELVLQRDWRYGGDRIEVMRRRLIDRPGYIYFLAAYGPPDGQRPVMRLAADERCRLLGGEAISYDTAGKPLEFQPLGPDLRPRAAAIPFNPDVPPADTDMTGCTRVAILDNGANYRLPQISERLARDASGALVGYDFWEDDDRPFDFGLPIGARQAMGSPFDAPRHGTEVVSVFLHDAPPGVCAALYRYHPGDPDDEIGAIVDRIAADGARVVAMATGRDRPWPQFKEAAANHPDILFVAAAGNNDVDLRETPIYPMAYNLDNLLVVAAAEDADTLWPRNNRGPGLVHLAVRAVDVEGLSPAGQPVALTGTSFAAPRVAALAGALARARPDWNGARLREEIVTLAEAKGTLVDGLPVLDDASLLAALTAPAR